MRRVEDKDVPGGQGEHPDPHRRQRQPLEQGGAGAPDERHAEDGKAERVGRRVAGEIERIGLQSLRPRGDAGRHLDGEHDRVDGDDEPQGAAKTARRTIEFRLSGAAAGRQYFAPVARLQNHA